MEKNNVPEFAILGHPNEGKSSVVSTLAEDDTVVISPFPGETVHCRVFPVTIDGVDIIRFVDTPGFQNPQKTLAWMKTFPGPGTLLVHSFCDVHRNAEAFRDECELLSPIERGAGIIYVVDGSRPLRKNDIAEMEILRLTGQPRMAIINCKKGEEGYLNEWKVEMRKHFNFVSMFNAHQATYVERIDLLESLKRIDPDWQRPLEQVILAFKTDWQRRNRVTAETICTMLKNCLTYDISEKYSDRSQVASIKQRLLDQYKKEIAKIEAKAHGEIKKLFKHNIFNPELPPQSILNEDLFNERTWRLLGLRPGQLALAAGITGGLIGAKLDFMTAGLAFGVFTTIGGAIGAGSVLLGGEHMARSRVGGIKLGKLNIKVGPNENIQFLYILLDRVLIYYTHIIHWAHSRRDSVTAPLSEKNIKMGMTSHWHEKERKICALFFRALRGKDSRKITDAGSSLTMLLESVLTDLSHKSPGAAV